MNAYDLTDEEFEEYRELIGKLAGIKLNDTKRSLIIGRLTKRLHKLGYPNFTRYKEHVLKDPEEMQIMVDLITTHETSFFRDRVHFDFLLQKVFPKFENHECRIWSAAASSGEEVYSLGMTAMEAGLKHWNILGTDISRGTLEVARDALYTMGRANTIPQTYLKKYCLKGVRSQEGYFLIGEEITGKISYKILNLIENFDPGKNFDIIFLRNVMIYFDVPTKQHVLDRLLQFLKPEGYLFIGLSESLIGINRELKWVQQGIFQKKN